jgi:glycerol dehydrogenase
MLRIFGAPSRYVQGPGALARLGDELSAHGQRPLVIADATVHALLRAPVLAGLGALADAARWATFHGECTGDEITRIAAEAGDADVVVGVGGGKTIDTAKGVSMLLGRRIVIVPTVASNDSPTSRLAVLYTAEHALSEVRLMPRNPDTVLVDTAVLAQAPERFFVAGIGDALSKKFESAQVAATGGNNFFQARPPFLAQHLGDACYEVIRRHSDAALAALRRRQPDEAFERVVEATVLLSGLAFESGGLSIAHAVLRGFSIIPALARSLHGEQVAFGLIVQWVLEGRASAEIDELLAFYARIGLPRTLAALGCTDAANSVAGTIARHTWAHAPYVRNLAAPVDAERIEAAILTADALGHRSKS